MAIEQLSLIDATYKTVGAVYAADTGEKAFDGNIATGYGPYPPDANSSVWVTFPQAQRLKQIKFVGHSGHASQAGAPTKGILYGSNDGGTTKQALVSWDLQYVPVPNYYSVTLPLVAEFTSYGFHLDPMVPGNVPFVGEIQFFGGPDAVDQLAEVSDLTTASFTTRGSVYSDCTANKMFDRVASTGYGPYPPSPASAGWVNYPGLAELKWIQFSGCTSYPTINGSPKKGYLYGSNDGGTTRVQLAAWDLPFIAPPELYTVILPERVKYIAYGIYVEPTLAANVPFVGELYLYNTEPGVKDEDYAGWGIRL